MKTKTEAKRQAILKVAAQAFRELGFERTSMSEICARVGGSKATLYSYFASKDELFLTVMHQSAEHELEAVLQLLDHRILNVAEALRSYGRGFLSFIYSPQVMAARRLIISEAGRSELGQTFYARGPQKVEAMIAEFLCGAMTSGKLRQADPQVAACHLRGLLEAELLDRFMFGVIDNVTPQEIEDVVERAINAFMAAYGV